MTSSLLSRRRAVQRGYTVASSGDAVACLQTHHGEYMY